MTTTVVPRRHSSSSSVVAAIHRPAYAAGRPLSLPSHPNAPLSCSLYSRSAKLTFTLGYPEDQRASLSNRLDKRGYSLYAFISHIPPSIYPGTRRPPHYKVKPGRKKLAQDPDDHE
jgi:hypothetical protein